MQEKPQKDWLYIISPCVIAMLFSVFGIVYSAVNLNPSGGWSGIGVILFSIFLLVVILVDVIVRLIIRKNAGLLWLVESLLLVVTVLIFRNKFL
jgi:hypothetical protein